MAKSDEWVNPDNAWLGDFADDIKKLSEAGSAAIVGLSDVVPDEDRWFFQKYRVCGGSVELDSFAIETPHA